MEKPNSIYFYYKNTEDNESFLINLKLDDLLIDYELERLGIMDNYVLEGMFTTNNGKIKSTEKYIAFKKGGIEEIRKLYDGKFRCFPIIPKPFDHNKLIEN